MRTVEGGGQGALQLRLDLKLSVSLVVPGQPYTTWTSLGGTAVRASTCPCFTDTPWALAACMILTFLSGPELLSADSLAITSPRLSPDQCRIVYLQFPSLVPHQQCGQLCLVSWGEGGGEVNRRKGWWMRAEESVLTPHEPLSRPHVLGAVMV